MPIPDLAALLAECAQNHRRPDGTAYRRLSTEDVDRLAEKLDCTVRRVEKTALAMDITPERYTRNMMTLSLEDQHRLLDSTVCVVGVGGLGGSVADILARIGIGRLRLVDGDHFEDSNLNRQRFADMASLGQPKADVAREAIAAINPTVEVTALTDRLTAENGAALLGEAHLAIDCLDTLQSRRDLQFACRQKKIPMISAAIAGVSGQLTVAYPADKSLDALYGDPSTTADRGAETTLGNLPYAVNLLASLECCEAVKTLLDRGPTLRGRLLLFDLSDLTFEVIRLEE